ncbi:protein kinase domain-containing protein [Leptothermofonsia sp. ETS-13]|uniref:protein kinase domain-containing protein n=1 Tax=Leptothermofonsia sp. ETS-13 TaxID=3035696 RepID=UPI003BA2DDC7
MNPLFEEDNSTRIVGKRYKLVNQLGVGGFGQSFLAQDLHLPGCPRCVVKRLLAKTHDPKHLKTARRLFDTEARVLYQLGKHDQIPTLYAHFEENQEFYLVQEFIEGEPLTWQIVKGKPWAEERVIALIYDILEIMAFVHQQNVIHRDIKPANLIRRQKDNRLVLIDFGAVKQVSLQMADPDSEIADSTIAVGTHGYISNEQLAGKPRFCSDVYAIGMVGIQALTGVLPKQLDEDAATGELDWRVHAPNVSPEFAEVLDHMVYYDFRDRFPTAVEALEALQNLPPRLLALVEASKAADADSAEQAKSMVLETDSTQREMGTTNLTGDMVATYPQAETLMYGEEISSVHAVDQKQGGQKSGWSMLKGQGFKWLEKFPGRGVALVSGLAIAGVAVLLNKPNLVQNPVQKPSEAPKVPSRSSLKGSVTPKPSVSPSTLPLSPEQKTATLLKEAERLRQQKQYQQALNHYKQVIQLQPNNAQAYWGQCESLNGLKQPDAAVVACNDALDLNPDYAEALWSKGKALRQQEQILEALRLFEEATVLKPDFAAAWLDWGSALQEVGRSVEAIDALDQAIALNRNSAEAWSIRGAALWNLGRFDQAISSLDKALQIQPNATNARALRQQAREELGY